jgi:uncharacterized protein (DUF302 family)
MEDNQMNIMQKMMITEYQSELDFDETISTLTESAKENGWDIPMTYDLQKGYHEAGYEDMTKVKILYFCDPHGGYKILQDDENKSMSVMMPMGVSVYEKDSGGVFVAGMSLERMSMVFGGTVKEVLQEGAKNYAKSLDNFAKPSDENIEIQVDGGRCCLGCISVTAIVGTLMAVLVLIASKLIPILMPKMMSKMMPKMMEMMDEAGVQPPCAQIIIEKLESQEKELK